MSHADVAHAPVPIHRKTMNPETTTQETNRVWLAGRHVPEIDGIRGLAILMVTLYRFGKPMSTESSWGASVANLLTLGDRGVDLFFVLSGFLITGILLDSKHAPHYFRNFLVRRSLRIFPLYFVSLFFLLWVIPACLGPSHPFHDAIARQGALWTYGTNLVMSWEGEWCFGPLDHYWSLAVEEHFYFVWPLVIFALTRGTSLRLALVLAGLSSMSRLMWAATSDNTVAPDVLTWFRADGLLMGASLALWLRGELPLPRVRRWAAVVGPLLFVVGIGLSLGHRRWLTVGHTVWPAAWAALLVWVLTGDRTGRFARFFQLGWLRDLGKYSYAMYVFQNPLIPLVGMGFLARLRFLAGTSLLTDLVYVATLFGLTYVLAVLSWHLLEKHCLRWKDRFSGHSPAAPQPSVSPLSSCQAT